MKKILMAVTVLAGLASGVYAQSAIEQLEDLSSSKVVPAPATAEPALLSADNAVCSPESAEANYIKLVKQGGSVTNLKINTSTVQLGNNKPKIVIIGSYALATPEFGPYAGISMAGYAFYDAATCAMGENLHVRIRPEPDVLSLDLDPNVCSPESAEANYIKRVTQGGEVTNLKINTSTVQFGNNERKIVIIGSYLRETPEFGVYGDIPMASYAFYNYATCAIGENLSVMTHAVK